MKRLTQTSLAMAIAMLLSAHVAQAAAEPPAPQTSPKVAKPNERLQLRTLPPPPKEGRFKMSYDRVWPEKPGQVHLCLWADDKYAAASITIDDNCQPDHAWWIEQGNKHGFRFTWFVVTGGIGQKTNSFAGKWNDFRKLRELGHDVQSHTVSHHSDDAKRPDEEVHTQYRDSKKAIEENVPGVQAVCMAYPYGSGKDAIAAEYFIACRGVVGGANGANRINYLRTKSLAIRPDSVDMLLTGKHASVKWLNRPTNRRAWLTPVYHYVRAGRTKEEKDATLARAAEDLAYLASKKDQIWVGLFRDVACYGMQRDTARLSVTKSTEQEIRLVLSDSMDETLFSYPLTVKVRLPDTWKQVAATQSGTAVEARLVEHKGGRFALVKAVPDKGEVSIVPIPDDKAASPNG
jgi:Polysaccharide deacetylase